MSVRQDPTPNPNALKFTVGQPVGGPATVVRGADSPEEFITHLLEIEHVASLFLTADFVTITKTPEGSWDEIAPRAGSILEARFGSSG